MQTMAVTVKTTLRGKPTDWGPSVSRSEGLQGEKNKK